MKVPVGAFCCVIVKLHEDEGSLPALPCSLIQNKHGLTAGDKTDPSINEVINRSSEDKQRLAAAVAAGWSIINNKRWESKIIRWI